MTTTRLYQGDLFDVLPTLAEASVDACVTDPPYGIGFMGREWDGTGVAFRVETWELVRRVLKPGAYLVAFGGTRTYHRMAVAIEDAGFEIRDAFAWLYGSGFPKNHDLGNGKGTALKPAYEPIVLAWKPFKGTIQKCHEAHGTAALNIDACRIGDSKRVPGSLPTIGNVRGVSTCYGDYKVRTQDGDGQNPNVGRWPANVVIDEEAAAAIDEQTGELLTCGSQKQTTHSSGIFGIGQPGRIYDDVGGASRFYYCAKPSREERDLGCHELTARPRDESRKEGNPGGDNPRNRGLQRRGNFHPTVKPIDLIRWLVRLVTPIGGTVLDPFAGSGTTGCACAFEGVNFIGIEREADYIAIAERRIAACAPLLQAI